MPDITQDSSLEGRVGRRIPKDEFLEMTRAYRNERHALIARNGNNGNDSRSCYYSIENFQEIISAGCTGVRIFYGVRTEPDGKRYSNMLLVGVRKNAVTGAEEVVKFTEGVIEEDLMYDWGSLCPPNTECETDTLIKEIDLG